MDADRLFLDLFSVGQAGEKAAGPIETAGPGKGEEGLYRYGGGAKGAGITDLCVAEQLPADLFAGFVGHAPLAGSGEGRGVEGTADAGRGDCRGGDASTWYTDPAAAVAGFRGSDI